MEKEKINIEYNVRTTISPIRMWQYFNTEDGLGTWFADKVVIKGDVCEFFWGKSSQKAKIIHNSNNFSIRFHWIDDEETSSYFQFKLTKDDITQVTTLIITDFVEADERDDAIKLWNTQIENLRRTIGL